MTRLPSSMRINRRYVSILGGDKEIIERALLSGLGTLGWAKGAPLFVTVEGSKNVVLSIDRGSLDAVRAAFELAPQRLTITRVSGTIKGLEK